MAIGAPDVGEVDAGLHVFFERQPPEVHIAIGQAPHRLRGSRTETGPLKDFNPLVPLNPGFTCEGITGNRKLSFGRKGIRPFGPHFYRVALSTRRP